ncbi:hypothetical protein Tco_0155753 [Tanacetum coccineum]
MEGLIGLYQHSDDDSDDGEILNELEEYGNAGKLCRKKEINSFDGDDLAFQCMIGFRSFVAYFDPFLPMNIITRKAYNTIMVDGLESTRRNLVAIVKDVYVFVGSFTYVIDFVVLEDIGEFIVSNMTDVVMAKSFRAVIQLEYDYVKGLISFSRIFDTYIYRMPCTIPRLKKFNWSKVPPIMVLSQRDLMSELKHAHEKNKFLYKNYLNLGPEYQVEESMKKWLIHGHVMSVNFPVSHIVIIHYTPERKRESKHLCRKAHLLEDKQIPSVGVFDEVIWMAFGGKTRDLSSIGEEMDKTTTLHQSLLKNFVQCLETASQSLATASKHTRDGVRVIEDDVRT